jgi:hypothetical protein
MEARDEGVSAARLERLVGEEGATIVGEETRGEERIFGSGKHRFDVVEGHHGPSR